MVFHNFELLGELNGLVEGSLLFLDTRFLLDPFRPFFDGLLELHVMMLVSIKFHVLPGLGKSRDQLTTGLTHTI